MVINKSNDIFRIANTDNITTFETNRIYPLNFCFFVVNGSMFTHPKLLKRRHWSYLSY